MKRVLKALLVDDEEMNHKILKVLLKGYPEIEIIGTASTLAEAERFAAGHRPDLIFLDIHLKEENGFDLLSRLSYAPQVIFVTSHITYAVRAFEIDAVDYLIKPVTIPRLDQALARLRRRTVETPSSEPAESDDVIIQRESGRLHVIPVAKIVAIVSEGNFTRVYLQGGEVLFLCRMIGEWERMLPAHTFLRADRTALFNLSCVRAVTSLSRNLSSVVVDGLEERFELGRAGSTRLREALRSN
ncbi:two component transcriptional regulator, LytTR family [Verrucomicrobium sp. GAS474]|uniref:LytR/AlgR family response regulator transcription factor n=1 Tax=Verrucomicrobium sp. GAS474 TaxID=1882831 RepID=UPI00087CADB4|nr:LytTR family DNA-binding domain-containing protein [Verrucomicrobium sp. GAS474]SDU12973.1 two component transcriptional regulator, LytTR family [Verrucomicrobium sp. GAS474]